jgi:hypothetical protein
VIETAAPVIEPEPEPVSMPTDSATVEVRSDEPEAALQSRPLSLALASVAAPASATTPPEPSAPEIDPALREAAKAAVIAAAASAEDATTAEAAQVQPAPSAVAGTSPHPVLPERPVTISVAAVPEPKVVETVESADPIWNADACPRDWVAAYDTKTSSGSPPDCSPTADLVAAVAEDNQSELAKAAVQEAEILAALPPIPRARPEPPADFKPSNPHGKRTTRLSMDWPDEPPPNCGAGKRAKWRFTDRRSGAKEWYCR